MWVTQDFRIEVIIVAQAFDDNVFLYEMINQAIRYSSQLVVQMYTGNELAPIFQNLYYQFSEEEKKYIKRNVLFDITYGTDCHCGTLMTKHAPITDRHGRFFNFLLYDDREMMNAIGLHPRMDELIDKYLKKKLSKLLNEKHVNYRKATRGEPLMFPTPFTKPDDIMNNLLEEVSIILGFLEKLGSMTPEKRVIFKTCSETYRGADVYAWYTEMCKLYK